MYVEEKWNFSYFYYYSSSSVYLCHKNWTSSVTTKKAWNMECIHIYPRIILVSKGFRRNPNKKSSRDAIVAWRNPCRFCDRGGFSEDERISVLIGPNIVFVWRLMAKKMLVNLPVCCSMYAAVTEPPAHTHTTTLQTKSHRKYFTFPKIYTHSTIAHYHGIIFIYKYIFFVHPRLPLVL